MAFFKPYKKTKAEMDSIPIKEGQVIFTIDTKELYIDVSNENRILALSDTTYEVASSTVDGLMTAADKRKLDSMSDETVGIKIDDETIKKDENKVISVPALDRTFRGEIEVLSSNVARLYMPSLSVQNKTLQEGDLLFCNINSPSIICYPTSFYISEELEESVSWKKTLDDIYSFTQDEKGKWYSNNENALSSSAISTWTITLNEPIYYKINYSYYLKNNDKYTINLDGTNIVNIVGSSNGTSSNGTNIFRYLPAGVHTLIATFIRGTNTTGNTSRGYLTLEDVTSTDYNATLYASNTITGNANLKLSNNIPYLNSNNKYNGFTILRYQQFNSSKYIFQDLLDNCINYTSIVSSNNNSLITSGGVYTALNGTGVESNITNVAQYSWVLGPVGTYKFTQSGLKWTSNNGSKANTTSETTWTISVTENTTISYTFYYGFTAVKADCNLIISLDGTTIVNALISDTNSIKKIINLSPGTHTLKATYSTKAVVGANAYLILPPALGKTTSNITGVKNNQLAEHVYAKAKIKDANTVIILFEEDSEYLMVASMRNATTGAFIGSTARLITTPDNFGNNAVNLSMIVLGTGGTVPTITAGSYQVSVTAKNIYVAEVTVFKIR